VDAFARLGLDVSLDVLSDPGILFVGRLGQGAKGALEVLVRHHDDRLAVRGQIRLRVHGAELMISDQ
jgi:hypothetical protein